MYTSTSSTSSFNSVLPKNRTLNEVKTPSLAQINMLAKRGRGINNYKAICSSSKTNDFKPPKKRPRTNNHNATEVKNTEHVTATAVVLEHPASLRRLEGEQLSSSSSSSSTCSTGSTSSSSSSSRINKMTLSKLHTLEPIQTNSSSVSPSACHTIDATNAKTFAFVSPHSNVTIGWNEMRNQLLSTLTPSPSPLSMTKDWVSNHYKWIVWKAASYACKFPNHCGPSYDDEADPRYNDAATNRDDGLNWFTSQRVLAQLSHRWKREHDNGESSCLKRIYENNASSQRFMILVVANIIRQPRGNNSNDIQWGVELTDGWYSIGGTVDKGLSALLQAGYNSKNSKNSNTNTTNNSTNNTNNNSNNNSNNNVNTNINTNEDNYATQSTRGIRVSDKLCIQNARLTCNGDKLYSGMPPLDARMNAFYPYYIIYN